MSNTTTMTTAELAETHGIRLALESASAAQEAAADQVFPGGHHYRATLTRRDADTGRARTLTIRYSTGPAITTEPTVTDILDCIVADAALGRDYAGDPRAFAAAMGYDVDDAAMMRHAAHMVRACERVDERLAAWLPEGVDRTSLDES